MDFAQKRKLILEGNMTRVIITLAAPLLLSNFIQTLYNLADTYFVGQLGGTEVAAVVLVWPLIFFFMSLGMGINIAGTALISQYVGSNRHKEAADIAGQILTFSFLFSIILAVSGYLLAPTAIRWMGGEGELLNIATRFLRIIFTGMPFMFTFFAFNSIKQGQGDTVTPTIFSGISAIANIILDPIFIFTLGLGVDGAAYATVLARCMLSIYAVYSLFHGNKGIQLKAKHLHLKKPLLWMIAKVGLPSSIGQSTTALGFSVLNGFIISFGNDTMAAFGIGNRINSLVLMPAMGIGAALATIVGQNLGAEKIERAKKAIYTSAIMGTIILSLGGFIMYLVAPTIVAQFQDDPNIVAQATEYLRLICLSMPLMGFFQIFIGTFQGSGHTVSAMIIMMGRLWGLRIPLISLFKIFTDWGSRGIWYAMLLSNFFICLVGLGIYSTGKWQKKVIKKKKIDLEEMEGAVG